MLVGTLLGTLYIYQGQEIGMINAPEDWSISEYKDLDSLNYYNYVKEQTGNDPVALKATNAALAQSCSRSCSTTYAMGRHSQCLISPENAKTWMRVHDNYKKLNVKQQTNDPSSVLSFWRELLRIRHANPEVFAQGVFRTRTQLTSLSFCSRRLATNRSWLLH